MDQPVSDALARFELDGRVALVTGASSGLGAAVARGLAGAGARVAVVARRYDRLTALADEIGGAAIACDLLDLGQAHGLVAEVAERLGGPEILVNVAGMIAGVLPAEDEALDAVMQTLTLNLVAPFRLSQEVFPHMVAAGGGAIVHVSSIGGQVGIPGIPQASYAASKAGLSGLTVELAVQWARHSIRVNTVAPGFFRSEITDELYENERQHEWLRRNTPLPFDGTSDDIVGAVMWLVSDAGRYVTGQTIVVDGGWTAK
ncbi:MAG: SDR family NAD(P)-dependent oxidoreductase [Acidimicrobiia bacterium]